VDSDAITTQQESVIETQPPASPSVAETGSESVVAPSSEANKGQAETAGWGGAIFAPKPVIVADSSSQPSVQRGDLVEPGPDVIEPVLIEHPELKYPKQAKRRKVEAVVRVRVLVDENGTVLEAKLEEKVGYGLDEKALEVAQKATFIPATKGTVQVKMWTVLPLAYRLKKD
jgi:TonB family protein